MNRILPMLLCLIAGLVFGVATGYWLAPRLSAPARGNLSALEQNDEPHANTGPRNSEKPEPQPEKKPEKPEPEKPAAPTDLNSAIESIKVDLPAPGTGVITGKVTLSNGTPLAGATIIAYAQITYGAHSDDLESEVRNMVRHRKLEQHSRREAKSESDGAYRVEGIGDYSYALDAKLAGYKIEASEHGSQWGVKAGGKVDFLASPVCAVTLEVFMPDGAMAQTAMVSYQKTTGERRYGSGFTWNSGDAPLELAPGGYSISAKTGDFEEYVAPAVKVEIVEGKATTVTLRLESKPSIVGKVTTPPDFNDEDMLRVLCLRYEGATPPERPDQNKATRHNWLTKTSNWSYQFGDLAPGNYLLAVLRDEKVAATTTVTVTAGVVRADMVAAARNRADYVIVHVLAPNGQPVSVGGIDSGYRTSNGSGTRGGRPRQEKDGSYWVPHYEGDGDRHGGKISYFVEVESEEYGNKEVEYEKTAASAATVQFVTPAFVNLTITGFEQFAAKDRLAVSLSKAGKSRHSYDRGSDVSAKQKLGPVEPGTWNIVLTIHEPGDEWRTTALVVNSVELRAGEQEVTLNIPALYTLRVILKDSKADQRVELSGEGNSRKTAQSDAQGVATFKELPAGTYEIRVERKRMSVNLNANAEVSFESLEVNAIKVEIKDSKGYAATLGLQSGDLLVALNGTKFTSEAQMSALFEGAIEEKSVKLTVARGASEFEVECEVAKLFKDGGAELKPATR